MTIFQGERWSPTSDATEKLRQPRTEKGSLDVMVSTSLMSFPRAASVKQCVQKGLEVLDEWVGEQERQGVTVNPR